MLDGAAQHKAAFTGTSITVSYDAASDQLTLSGYHTIAHYNLVLSAVGYNTTGDNPTNYATTLDAR